MSSLMLYGVFTVIVAVLLAIDLFVVHRNTHAVSLKEAGLWTAVWVSVSVLFGLFMPQFYHGADSEDMILYFTAYVVEWSLSVDNVMIFVLIFQTFAVPKEFQHRVLFYGVLGAIVMRVAVILAGVALVKQFEWVLYVFGVFLLYLAWKTWVHRGEIENVADSRLMKVIRRVLPTTDDYRGEHFVVREQGRLLATPLLMVLVMVNVVDLIFATDSIPAVFAITRDPFIVVTSNIFAILGLRALYFLIAGLADRLYYLKAGLAIILAFVGLKLLTENIERIWHPSPVQSLGIIALILAVVVIMSWLRDRKVSAQSVPAAENQIAERRQLFPAEAIQPHSEQDRTHRRERN
ncbi:MAG TPA: TerC family protein [Gammaproteobacteria bacterium]|jgi:tellurite resistance protein TerC|nr:TerC family protein [Gammaproteobacteria bacterium]